MVIICPRPVSNGMPINTIIIIVSVSQAVIQCKWNARLDKFHMWAHARSYTHTHTRKGSRMERSTTSGTQLTAANRHTTSPFVRISAGCPWTAALARFMSYIPMCWRVFLYEHLSRKNLLGIFFVPLVIFSIHFCPLEKWGTVPAVVVVEKVVVVVVL